MLQDTYLDFKLEAAAPKQKNEAWISDNCYRLQLRVRTSVVGTYHTRIWRDFSKAGKHTKHHFRHTAPSTLPFGRRRSSNRNYSIVEKII